MNNPKIIITTIESLKQYATKCYVFTEEYQFKKGLNVTPDMISQTFCFFKRSEGKALYSPSCWSYLHIFDMVQRNSTNPDDLVLNIPKYQRDLPHGTGACLDFLEWNNVMSNRVRMDKSYQKNIKKMEIKNKETYNIKTPLPNEKHDYCQVCKSKFANFREHLLTMEHRAYIKID